MADIWYDVDTALSEVPINLMPLIDNTDFKSIEASVVYNQAGLDLLWNFVTTAGAFSQTAVTPTDTGGSYDFVNQGHGYYTIEMPASGGASINNDTEGFGWFSGFATGILPWRSAVYGFRAAATNNALIDAAFNGSSFSAIPWNAAWDEEVQSECADAIVAADFASDADVAAAVRDVSNVSPAAGSLGAAINTIDDLIDTEFPLLMKWWINKLVRTDNEDGTITYVLYDDNGTTPLKTWVYTTATGTRAKAT